MLLVIRWLANMRHSNKVDDMDELRGSPQAFLFLYYIRLHTEFGYQNISGVLGISLVVFNSCFRRAQC